MELVNTFGYHRDNPNISLDQYIRSKRIELGESLKKKVKIYLDTKYWIYFRDVYLRRITSGPLVKSYELLESLCKSGIVICPISEDVFYEIIKQEDEKTLSASIKIIDKFSLGISLTSQEERIQAEILHFYYRYNNKGVSLYSPEVFAWTKTSQSLGTRIPCNTAFSKQEELVIQKVFFDQMWCTNLQDICSIIGFQGLKDIPKMPDLSKLLNEDAEQCRDKTSTFKAIFIDEVCLSVEYIADMLTEAMEHIYTKETGKVRSDEEKKDKDKLLINVVTNMFRLGKEGDNFPTLKVGAGVHAAIRVDKKRQFQANDYYDFRHAQAAVPYCDYFFTEKNLRHLLKMNSLSYDKEYSCEIVSKQSEALKILTDIETKRDLEVLI
ncbi:hypothetical protein PSECIP111854_04082 [Pseudoalteromonas sp. CIP111854]|uniref:Uncharacterized protein n=2 Tax=Pseudoalteromonas holothuriae TaxID=2963714 RepID=A0A9W4R5E7_9GAMM|nr:hypothetical protein PSECIP111854_04082 [Pseudoalteromonas sp. CIP111854]